ncbi:MAG: ABC transporter ATP-binding protein [Muribaculaceae bacterium]|nr:ABC transporter ATP-binding protein [Muribaculaceae bacterium]
MLQVQNLTFGYSRKGQPLFSDFSLNLKPGCVCGLLGKNGAGKSTLIYLMAGLLTPDGGCVTMRGVDVRKRQPSTLSDVFIVPEEYELPPVSLERYVSMNAPFYPRFSHDEMSRYLSIFEMDPRLSLKSLSMGQRKKVLICFALATGASLLLLDEPTNGLDIPSKSQFRKAIAQCMTPDRSIVISTHQVRDIDTILDHVVIVDHSNVLLDASVGEIARRLTFGTNVRPDALYVHSTPMGPVSVSPNTDGQETPIDMELLFNATLMQHERMKELFTRK